MTWIPAYVGIPDDFGGLIALWDDPWSDALREEIRSYPHYQTAQDWAMGNDSPIEESPYYLWMREILDSGGTVWNGIISDEAGARAQYHRFRRIWEACPEWDDSAGEIVVRRMEDKTNYYYGALPVKVSDGGKLILWDGRHRASCLLSKNLPIQVTICEREPAWDAIRERLRTLYPGPIYQPIPHPDYRSWPASRDGKKEAVISDLFTRYDIRTVLDLGCCHGWTLYSLRRQIEWGCGVESEKTRADISRIVLDACGFSFWRGDILEHLRVTENRYGAVLALAVLHHLGVTYRQERVEWALRRMAELAPVLLYEIPEPGEPLYIWIPEAVRERAHEWIRETTGMEQAEEFQVERRKLIVLRRPG